MWKYCEIYCVSITIYIKGKKKKKTEDFEKKKKSITTVATWYYSYCLKLKKKKNGRTKWLNKPKWHCKGIESLYIANRLIEIIAKD